MGYVGLEKMKTFLLSPISVFMVSLLRKHGLLLKGQILKPFLTCNIYTKLECISRKKGQNVAKTVTNVLAPNFFENGPVGLVKVLKV